MSLNRALSRMIVVSACIAVVSEVNAQNRIAVDKARIGCLDIQKTGNLTGVVAKACNGQQHAASRPRRPSSTEPRG
jgi:hypothetical protein